MQIWLDVIIEGLFRGRSWDHRGIVERINAHSLDSIVRSANEDIHPSDSSVW